MKIKILFFALFIYADLFSLILDTNNTNYYLNVRAVNSDKQSFDGVKDNSSNDTIIRLGIRHKQSLGDDLLLDADIRAVVENQDKSNFYLDVKKLSLEFPLLSLNQIRAKIGRMSFKDRRTWWYDNELDAIQIFHKESVLSWDIAAGGRLEDNRISNSEQRVGLKDSRYFISHLDYQYYYKKHIEFFGLYEDNNKNGQKLSWLGIRSFANYKDNIEYWVDGGTVFGDGVTKNIDHSVFGYAFDTGVILRYNKVSFAVDLAYGSGDSNTNNPKKQFIQPNISNNKTSILGESRYRYYGEVIDPKLSNLQILSLFAGTRVLTDSWIETAYHYYKQTQTSRYLDSSLSITPNGKSSDIGHGVDIVLGGKYDDKNRLQLAIGGFWGGKAFEGNSEKKDGYRAHIDYKHKW